VELWKQTFALPNEPHALSYLAEKYSILFGKNIAKESGAENVEIGHVFLSFISTAH
jgi:hypothetical protein